MAQSLADSYAGFQQASSRFADSAILTGCMICGALCFICAMPQRLVFLSIFIALATFCTIATAPLIIVYFFGHAPKGATEQAGKFVIHGFWNPHSATEDKLLAITHMVYSFLAQPSIPSIVADMEEPKKFPRALASSVVTQLTTFGLYGLLGYFAIGSDQMVSPAFKALSHPWATLGVVLLMIPAVVGQASLFAVLLVRFIWKGLQLDKMPSGRPFLTWTWWIRKLIWAVLQGTSLLLLVLQPLTHPGPSNLASRFVVRLRMGDCRPRCRNCTGFQRL